MQEDPQQFDPALKSAQENNFSLTREACQFATAFFGAHPNEIHINREFISFNPNDSSWQKRADFNELKTVHEFFVEYCKKNNLDQADLGKKISHSFYCFDRNPLDIVATKRKEDYVAKKQLPRDDKELIPHGSFGKFREGISLQTGALTGVKMTVVKSDKDCNKIVAEAKITYEATGEDIKCVSRLRSDSQKPFLKQKEGQIKVATKMPLYPGIELYDWLNQNPNMWLTIEARLKMSLALIEAVKAMQDKLIMHRDIKPENIVVDVKGSDVSLKLIDFGLAQKLDFKEQYWESNRPIGTVFYTAPSNLGYYANPKKKCITDIDTDVWSAGMVMAFLLGKGPLTSVPITVGLDSILIYKDAKDFIDQIPLSEFDEDDSALYEVLQNRDFSEMIEMIQDKLKIIQTVQQQTNSEFREHFSKRKIPAFTFQYLLANNRDILVQNADCLSKDQIQLLVKEISPQDHIDGILQLVSQNEDGKSRDAAIKLLNEELDLDFKANIALHAIHTNQYGQLASLQKIGINFDFVHESIGAEIQLLLGENNFASLIKMVEHGILTKKYIDGLKIFESQNTKDNIPFVEACFNKEIIDLSKFVQYVGKDYINQHHMLSKAIQSADIEAVKILLEAGAKNTRDGKALKSVDYAVKTGNHDIITLLEQKFGKIAAPADGPRRTLVVGNRITQKPAGKSSAYKNTLRGDKVSEANKSILGTKQKSKIRKPKQ